MLQAEPIRPDHRFQLRIDFDLIEELGVLQRLKHRSPQLTAEVDRTLQTIVNAQPEARVRQWLNLEDARDHGHQGETRSSWSEVW